MGPDGNTIRPRPAWWVSKLARSRSFETLSPPGMVGLAERRTPPARGRSGLRGWEGGPMGQLQSTPSSQPVGMAMMIRASHGRGPDVARSRPVYSATTPKASGPAATCVLAAATHSDGEVAMLVRLMQGPVPRPWARAIAEQSAWRTGRRWIRADRRRVRAIAPSRGRAKVARGYGRRCGRGATRRFARRGRTAHRGACEKSRGLHPSTVAPEPRNDRIVAERGKCVAMPRPPPGGGG